MADARRRLLAVFAHPDDETFLAGGTMARHAAEGWDVRLLTFTRGEAGRRGPYAHLSQHQFGILRETELRAACASLGVAELQLLGFSDKSIGTREAEAAEAVNEALASWQPTIVLTFGPDGISGHVDHVAVSAIVTGAVQRGIDGSSARYASAKGPRLYYVSRSPGVPSCCTSHGATPAPPITTVVDVVDVLDAKRLAMSAYRSQSHLQTTADGTLDSLTSEMFHRVFPAWSSPTAETVRLLR